ncbi:hypothetical protein [Bradyrhizobium cenepequi]|uniref:hypothetical protein n=1 Tax=Bradyrhizobium cenepequi TaxID=2821403 RepID=UPI001CE2ACCF|nr:hypothetical protein [Bradyrhizobium cenepequi]MCA6111333.1 hypothetical protein [Bradyrhizobium cenepequi]
MTFDFIVIFVRWMFLITVPRLITVDERYAVTLAACRIRDLDVHVALSATRARDEKMT